jgi:hypothetical protein
MSIGSLDMNNPFDFHNGPSASTGLRRIERTKSVLIKRTAEFHQATRRQLSPGCRRFGNASKFLGVVVSGTAATSLITYLSGFPGMAIFGMVVGTFGGVLATAVPMILDWSKSGRNMNLEDYVETIQNHINGDTGNLEEPSRFLMANALTYAHQNIPNVGKLLEENVKTYSMAARSSVLTDLSNLFLNQIVASLARGILVTEMRLATLRTAIQTGRHAILAGENEGSIAATAEALELAGRLFRSMVLAQGGELESGSAPGKAATPPETTTSDKPPSL